MLIEASQGSEVGTKKVKKVKKVKRPTISVLMAARDAEATISIAAKSTLLALGKRDELLVYLDGCMDNTASAIHAIDDTRLRIYGSQDSIGRSGARNYLSLKAKGDCLAILDSDDISFPWRFLHARRLLRTHDAVFGGSVLFGDLPFRLPFAFSYPVSLSADLAPSVLTYRNPFIHSTAVFRREAVIVGELYEDVLAEEYLLWVRMALRGVSLFRSPLPVIGYRLHRGQVSNSADFYQNSEKCPILNSERELLAKKIFGELRVEPCASSNKIDYLRQIVLSQSIGIRFEEQFLAALKRRLKVIGVLFKLWEGSRRN